MGEHSGLLFARPSFVEGFARILDLRGTLNEYNRSATGDQADREALEADWRAIGQDLVRVMDSYKATNHKRIDGPK